MTPGPYYDDGQVTLYHADCREITEWLNAGILCTDPPFGRGWRQGRSRNAPSIARRNADDSRSGIPGDKDTSLRDAVLALWGQRRCAIVFGDLMLAPPAGNKHTLIYQKPPGAGGRGAVGGYRRDAEAIYLVGPWPAGLGGRSSILTTGARTQGGPASAQSRYQHPHAKPVDILEELLANCPPGTVVADPFAGCGSSLIAARNRGLRAIGVELEERYCEITARRLSQTSLAL